MKDLIDQIRMKYYQRKGQKMLLRGEPERAFIYLEKALFLEDSAANIYNIALTLLTLKRYSEAESYLQKLLDNYPGNELASLTMVELYMQQRDWDKAIDLLSELVTLHPSNNNYKRYLQRVKNPEAREGYIKAKEMLNEAQELLARKEKAKALETLLKAEKIDPENPYIQNNIGSFYLMLEKNPKRALTYFQKAYELEPENEKFKTNLFRVRREIKE